MAGETAGTTGARHILLLCIESQSGPSRTSGEVRVESAKRPLPDMRKPLFDHLVGAPGITAATPSGLMLKAKNVKGVSLGFPH